jgi:hypothetical protein
MRLLAESPLCAPIMIVRVQGCIHGDIDTLSNIDDRKSPNTHVSPGTDAEDLRLLRLPFVASNGSGHGQPEMEFIFHCDPDRMRAAGIEGYC